MKYLPIFLVLVVSFSCGKSEKSIFPIPQSEFYYSCTPIGWSRDNIEDRKADEYWNELTYPSYSLEQPPLWLKKEALTIKFNENYFNGKSSNNLLETSITFGETIIENKIKWCLDFTKSPLGSCQTNTLSFNRITYQLEKIDIDASELEGERSLYNCSEVKNIGKEFQKWSENMMNELSEDTSNET